MTATMTADDVQLERRRLTAPYLRLRLEWEIEQDNTDLSARYETATKDLVAAVAAEAKTTEDAARAAVQNLTANQTAERYVELWADDAGVLYGLPTQGIVAVADSVRSSVAYGATLDEIPMMALAEPYLTGGEL